MDPDFSDQLLQQEILQSLLLFPRKFVIRIRQGHLQEAFTRKDPLVELLNQSSWGYVTEEEEIVGMRRVYWINIDC